MKNPQVRNLARLFVFLCGSYGIPAKQQLITATAAQLGYHAINLSYPNAWTVGGLCRDSREPDCHGQVRRDILSGTSRSGLVQLSGPDGIQSRLQAVLHYLHAHYPAQGWHQFLNEQGAIQWQKIVVAGHSQGGGHAALIGKRHPVARVIMLAAPVDYVKSLGQHAKWLREPGATSSDRYFGFVHYADQGFDRISRAWNILGLEPTDLAEIDHAQPPYHHARGLVTNVAQVRRDKFHASIVQDNLTPLGSNGEPLFEPAWRHLLTLDA